MRFAKIVFRIAGIWGFLVLTPLYFLFDLAGRQNPPAITHPEFYYVCIGVALVWQVAFFIIASDPVRFRPFMIAAILEKLAYFTPVILLYLQHRVASNQLIWVCTDFTLCLLFVVSYFKTPRYAKPTTYEKLQ
jgi:hypothetical protein